jgi:hypothetical protein
MMIKKMKRLSTDRLYSVIQPAKNSPAYRGPETNHTPSPKRTASPTKTPIAVEASRVEGSCGRRPMMNTSTARMATMTTTVMAQA